MSRAAIPDYPGYSIDHDGQVFRLFNEQLSPVPTSLTSTYPRVTLIRCGKKIREHIHVLMAVTFLGLDRELHGASKHSLQVDHRNDDKRDNRLENLEVVTRGENQDRARKNGRYINAHGGASRGSPKYTLRRFSQREVAEIRELREKGLSYREIGDRYDADCKVIYRIVKRITYQKP